MIKQEAKKRIQKLKETINHHRYLYHVLDKPEISDEALDSLKHELKELEDKFPEFRTPDSPTQRVGGEALDKFEKVRHSTPMLSIEDVFNAEEIYAWEAYLNRLTDKKANYFCEVKIDGLALSLVYRNGVLERAATRGNGLVGENVTENARTIETIPLRLKLFDSLKEKQINKNIKIAINEGVLEIRGEVYMPVKDFEKFNKEREKRGQEKYANPRNLAAGSIRQLDPSLTASRPLFFMAYDIVTDIGAKYHSQEHEALKAIGFRTDPTAKECKNVDDITKYWENIQKKREKISYQIDGVVIAVNDNELFQELGVAGKSPRGTRAFKFAAKQATTVIEDVKVQVGRTGAVTPIAILKPVNIGGVQISRASLHNFEEIDRLDARIGDTVVVERAGDVIPKVVEVVQGMRKKGSKKIKPPVRCPECGQGLVKKEGEAILRCINPNCESRKREHLYHFVSRAGFDIDGLGPKIINKLLDEELISDAVDIFTLEKGDLVLLEGFQEKSAQNVIDAVDAAKKIPLSRLINALNIRHVGMETSVDLAEKFGSIKKLEKAPLEEFYSIEGIGSVVAEELHEWFSKEENLDFVHRLINTGVEVEQPKRSGTKLKGKTFVFTGSLKNMTREEGEQKVRELGGDPSGSVSRNTDYVVAGDNPGSKYDKAKKLGIKILTEKEFQDLVS